MWTSLEILGERPWDELKVLRRWLGSSEGENGIVLVLWGLGVFFRWIFEGLGSARKDASVNVDRRLRAGFQTLGIKRGAEDWGDARRAPARSCLLLPGVFTLHSKPQNPYFQVQNFSEAVDPSFLHQQRPRGFG